MNRGGAETVASVWPEQPQRAPQNSLWASTVDCCCWLSNWLLSDSHVVQVDWPFWRLEIACF